MIQYPINVVPQNKAYPISRISSVQFTFQGDYLYTCWLKVFDYDTKELVTSSFSQHEGFNGDIIQHSLNGNLLTNGNQYVYQLELIQKNGDFINDMPVLGGRIRGIDNNGILVADEITEIYPFSHVGNVYSRAENGGTIYDNMTIKIGNETHNIVRYTTGVEIDDKTYGVIETDTAFSTTLTEGMQYQIYSSFIITPQYYFNCTAVPTVTLSGSINTNSAYITGTYSQAQQAPIKYYTLKLWWSNNSAFSNSGSHGERAEVIADTGKLFSQDIYYTFKNFLQHSENTLQTDVDYYKVVCSGETSDGVSFESEPYVFTPEITDYSSYEANKLHGFELNWDGKVGAVKYLLTGNFSAAQAEHFAYTRRLYRKNLVSGEEMWFIPDMVGYQGRFGQSILFTDITASCRGRYRYTLYSFDHNNGIIKPVVDTDYDGIGDYPCNDIETKEYSYYISDLEIRASGIPIGGKVVHENSKQTYYVGQTWRISGEISDTTVTSNTDVTKHVGYNKYSKTTSTDVNYMSGTLSGLLGYVDCATQKFVDNVELVQAWRKFITQKRPFLLKSQKGDVWIVEITDSPTTQYSESENQLLTTFSISWAECCSINDIIIRDDREDYNYS